MPSGVLTKQFPFSAVKGMDEVKKALECAMVDDDLKGVLIKGPTGTAKSLLVRSFADLLPGKDIVNIPQNVTDEQLFGSIDLEHAIKHGRTLMKDGLLKRADNNILYLDNVNLFDRKILGSIMDCVEIGRVIVEREGVSAEYECRTTVVATMDPAERALSEHISDRFDICVQTYSSQDHDYRCEIISSNLNFDNDPDAFIERYSDQERSITKSIISARSKLTEISITESDISMISQICMSLNVVGYRGDVSVAKVARALTALDDRDEISDDDIRDAAVLCLLHRRTELKESADEEDQENGSSKNDVCEVPEEDIKPHPNVQRSVRIHESAEQPESASSLGGKGIGKQNLVSEITDAVRNELDHMDKIESIRLHEIAGSNRRSDISTRRHSGRYRGSKIPDGKSSDPAFDATIRAAAPFQTIRDKGDLSIAIESQDIRDKIRVKRDSCSFLFAVDVSGSLVNSGMMRDIKDGVKAMLMDGYVQRDKVALMTFCFGDVRISVPFTRSVERICDTLDNTITGGGTPLGSALLMIREYLLNYIRKNPEERCYVILMTDGDATDPVVGGKPASIELKKITAIMNIPRTEWIVVDSSLIQGRVNHALKLAKMLNGQYIKLEDLRTA